MQIFLCRHGETAWTLSGQHTSSTDIPLTDAGKKEAALLGKRLKSIPFTAIFSSPMRRAVETCECAHLPDPTLEPDAVEWDYGDYEGLTSQEIHVKNPTWLLFKQGAPRGESIEDVSKRADRLLKKFEKYTGNIALFSHGHFSRVLAARWLGLPAQDGRLFYLSVASLSILGHDKEAPAIRLWNDTSHLKP